jgi:hypothetical protein
MKKLIGLIGLLLCAFNGTAEITYVVNFNISYIKKIDTQCSLCSIGAYAKYSNGNQLDCFGNRYTSISPYNALKYTRECKANEIREIVIGMDSGSGYLFYHSIYLTYPCMNEEKTITLSAFDITYSLTVKPKSLSLTYYDHNGLSEELYLYDNKSISLVRNYILSYCDYSGANWEFYIGGYWYQLPASVSSSLYFSGEELFTMLKSNYKYSPPYFSLPLGDFRTVVKNKSSIRVRYRTAGTCQCGEFVSDELVLHPRIVAPTITSIDKIPETCYKSKDGKLIVHFSRALYEDEALDIMYSIGEYSGGTVQVPALSDSCVISGLSSGTYKIILAGRYPYYSKSNPGNETYVQDAEHKASATLNPAPNIYVNSSVSDILCNGGADGMISLSVSGGTGNYYAKYSDNDSTGWFNFLPEDITGLTAGTYTIQIRDENGCFPKDYNNNEITIQTKLTEPEATSIKPKTINSPTGYKRTDGLIEVSASGGTDPYTYEWTKDGQPFTPTSQEIAENLGAGTYFVTVKDSNFSKATETNCRGCYDTLTVVLSQPDSLEVQVVENTNIKCKGATGSLKVTVKGGVKPYQPYTLTTNGTASNGIPFPSYTDSDNFIVENLYAGKYKITVTDVNGNTTTSPEFKLSEPDVLTVSNLQHTNPSCYGSSDGRAEVTVTGGTQQYSYDWTHNYAPAGTNSAKITGLSAGTYYVHITDANGCSVDTFLTLNQPDTLTAKASITLPSAYNASDGQITITPAGGTQPYSYQWDYNSSTDSFLTGIPARDNPYTVTVTDKNGCTVTLDTVYVIYYPMEVTIAVENAIPCHEDVGALKATATGGTAGKTYQWYKKNADDFTVLNGATSAILNNIVAGTYRVEVKDSRTGNASEDFVFTEPAQLNLQPAVVKPTVYNSSDGKITITPTGGTPPYSYKWNYNNSTANPLTGIPASDTPYRVTVTDAKGCTAELDVDLICDLEVEITVTTPVLCNGGTGTLSAVATGGVGTSYTYEWFEINAENSAIRLSSTTAVLQGVKTGKYKVKVTDAKNTVTESQVIQFTQPEKLTAKSEVTDPSAYDASDGKITIIPSGGTAPYSYKWHHNNSTANPLTGISAKDDPYKVTVTDANGCTTILDDIDAVYYPMDANIIVKKAISCYGGNDGSLQVSVTGGTSDKTYKWYSKNSDNNFVIINAETAATLNGLSAGTYQVEATDSRNVTILKEIDLSQPELLTAEYSIIEPSAHDASDGQIKITAGGGTPAYSYKWNYNNSTDNPLTSVPAREEPYRVTVTDSKNCTATLDNISVVYYPMIVDIVAEKEIACFGETGNLKAVVRGGTSNKIYQWYLKNKDNNFEYISGETGAILQNRDTGTYRVRVKDENDTTKYSEFELNQPEQLTAEYEIVRPSAYNASDGQIKITASGGTPTYYYKWDYNNSTANPLINIPARDEPYTVTVKDAKGCSIALDPRIIYPLAAELKISDSISCYDGVGTLQAIATGGVGTDYSYQWYKINEDYYNVEEEIGAGKSASLGGITAGKYLVQVTDKENNRKKSNIVDLTQPDLLTAEYDTTLPSAHNAADGKIEITVSGGTEPYSYILDSQPATNPVTGIPARDNPYKITVKDAEGCSVELNPRIIYPLSVKITVVDSIPCYGGTGTLKAIAVGGVGTNYSYKWYKVNNGISQVLTANGNILTNALTGTYRVEATDIENTVAGSANLTIPQPEQLTADYDTIPPSAHDAADGKIEITVSGGTVPYSYTLDDQPATNPVTGIPARDNPYKIIVKDAEGCSVELNPRMIYPLSVKITAVDSIPCYGGTGTLKAIAVGGVGTNYSYRWYKVNDGLSRLPDANGNILTNVLSGTYRVEAIDIENTIARSTDLTISQPAQLTADHEIILPSAYNASDGKIMVTASGGTAPYFYTWENHNSITDSLTNIPANDNPYKVTVTDAKGCKIELNPLIIYPLAVELKVADSIPCYDGTGTLQAIATGGAGTDYSYQWYKSNEDFNSEEAIFSGKSAMLTNVTSGKYSVKVTDIKGNTEQSGTVEVTQPDFLFAEYSVDLPSTHDAFDGRITITTGGGTPPYSYDWEHSNDITDPFADIPARDNPYKITVTDIKGCSKTIDDIYVIYYPMNVDIGVDKPVSCHGESDGQLRAVATGGVTANRIYNWYKIVNNSEILIAQGNSDTLTNLCTGIYRVKVTDLRDSAVISANFELIQPDSLTAIAEITLPAAYNTSDGKIEVLASGGTVPYFYKWDYNNSPANPLENIPANDNPYTVTVSDSRGCTKTLSPRVIYPLTVEIAVIDSISCYLGNNGTLKAVATGGVGTNYSYKWHKIELGNDKLLDVEGDILSGIDAGRYYAEATDVEGNKTSSAVLEINHPTQLKIDYEVILTSSADATDGKIDATVSGGSPGYSYLWDYNNNTTNVLTELPSGQTFYKLTVTDRNGCRDSISTRLVYPMKVNISIEDSISCYENTDGRLKANAVGGLSKDYAYQWYKLNKGEENIIDGATGEELPDAGAGIYRVRVADLEENTASADITFNSPDLLTLTPVITMPSAYNTSDGAIRLTVKGGTPGYSYAWNYNSATNDRLTNIPANDTPYTVTVSDTRNCSVTISPRIIYPPEVKIIVVDSITCYGRSDGQLKAVATGGVGTNYLYQWYRIENGTDKLLDGENTVTLADVGEGKYRVKATDIENTSVLSNEFVFVQPDLLTVDYSIAMPSAYNASDGGIKLTVKGGTPGYFYSWNYNGATGNRLSDIPANDTPYTVTVSDTRNCSATVSPRIIYPLEVEIIVVDSITCYGRSDGQLKAVATGGVGTNYSYQWYRIENGTDQLLDGENTVTLTDVGEGKYRVKATDIENTSVLSNEIVFVQPDLLTVKYSITMPSAYNASDGDIKLTVKGGTPGYFYSWNYNGATGDRLADIPANDTPYTVTVNDTRNCSATVSPRIIYPLEVEIIVVDSITCYGRSDGQLKAVATGGVGTNYSYQWYKVESGTDKHLDGENTPVLAGVGEGEYRVKVTDNEDNTSTTALIFNQPELLQVNVEYLRNELRCKFDTDGFVKLAVTGGTLPYSYLWSDGTAAAINSSLPEGSHTFEVTDRRGCNYSGVVEIASPDELTVDIYHIEPKAFNSADAYVHVEAKGGTAPYKYLWNDRSETAASLNNVTYGTYTAVVTDANGCTKKITDTVPNPPLLEVFISEISAISCKGRGDGKLTADSQGGTGSHEYVWYRIDGNNIKQTGTLKDADDLPAGTYRVQVIDGNGIAANSTDFELGEPAALKAFTSSSGISCQGTGNTWVEASAEGGTEPYSYLWTSGHRTARVEELPDDKYMVLVTDAHGCETKSTAEIRTAPEMTVETSAVQPSCAADGAIALNVKGGIAPYTFLWNDGSTDKNRNNLPAGNYSVTITGANECSVRTDIKLDKAEPVFIDLGNDRAVLCKGQHIEFNVTNIDGTANYRWFRDGKPFAETPVVSIHEEGLYRVEVINSKGCRSEGSIDISVENSNMEADFTVATKAIRHEITKLVNISYPYPDKVEWIIPKDDPDIAIIDITDEYVEMIFKEKGSYTIGLRASTGECQTIIYKQIDVFERYDIPEYEPEQNVFLKSFIAYPNPNNGQFTVKIELGATADIRLRLVSITGSIIDDRKLTGSDYYEILYNINNVQGIYLLQLSSEKAETSLKLVMDSF